MKPMVGMSSSFLAFAITLTQLEQGLRVAGAAVGLAIGIITLVRMIRGRQ